MQDLSKFRDGLLKQRHLTFRRKQYSLYAGRIQIPWWSTYKRAPHLQQETIFTLCKTYSNSEMVYVNKCTSTSSGYNIHLCKAYPNSEMVYVNKGTSTEMVYENKGTSPSAGKNIHLMFGHIQIPTMIYVNKGTSPSA